MGERLPGLYEIVAPFIAVAVLVWMARIASRIGGDAAFSEGGRGRKVNQRLALVFATIRFALNDECLSCQSGAQ